MTDGTTQEFTCRAYRVETYVTYEQIEASSPQEAISKLRQMEEDGELVYADFCTSEAACEFVVEDGEAEIIESRPQFNLFAYNSLVEGLTDALKAALAILDEEIERRKSGGNVEHWATLQVVSDAGHAAIKAATANN